MLKLRMLDLKRAQGEIDIVITAVADEKSVTVTLTNRSTAEETAAAFEQLAAQLRG